jgi:hypothetical protein
MTDDEMPTRDGRAWFFEFDHSTGEPGQRFNDDGPVEVWLGIWKMPPRRQGDKPVFIPIQFPNFPLARRGVEEIEKILPMLNAKLEIAANIGATNRPTKDDGHEHVIRFERFTRTMPVMATCEVCLNTFREVDMGEASHAAALLGVDVRDTLKAKIEREVNE